MQIEVSQRRFRVLFVFFLLFLFHAEKKKIYCALFSSKFRKIKKKKIYIKWLLIVRSLSISWRSFAFESVIQIHFLPFHSLRPECVRFVRQRSDWQYTPSNRRYSPICECLYCNTHYSARTKPHWERAKNNIDINKNK